MMPVDQQYTDDVFENDDAFHQMYRPGIRFMAKSHWTPLRIAKEVASFLNTNDNCKILDIGSGSGKFCLAAAWYSPRALLYGVEQRGYMVREAKTVQKKLGLNNVAFIEGNFTALDLTQYDHFYFFNSFWENLDYTDKIDYSIDYSEALYEYYITYLRNGLAGMPAGTRIVTYHSLLQEIPKAYFLVKSSCEGMLNFWIKQ